MGNDHLAQPLMFAGAPLGQAARAAIVVHGRAQDPEFMLEVIERIGVPDVSYVLPRAAGKTWYPQRFTAPIEDNEPHLGHALSTCEAVMGHIESHGIGKDRTYLIGFSQGACLLTEFLVRRPVRYAGAALLTGGFIGPQGPKHLPSGDLAGMPVFLGSSRHDEWVPLARVHETATLLRTMSATVTMQIYDDRDHIVNDAAVRQTRALMESP